MRATLHLLGLPHTVVSNEQSHCAFTGKVFRFSKMMQRKFWNVIEYSNEGSQSEAKTKVQILDSTALHYLKELHKQEYPNDVLNMNSTLCKVFNEKLTNELRERVQPGDIICHTFGQTSRHLVEAFPNAFHVETGIGYHNSWAEFRIFESYAWWHYTLGAEQRGGGNYEFVIPNYYDIEEWTPNLNQGDYVLYFGRIQPDKGLHTIQQIARHLPQTRFIMCGNGDPKWFLDDGIPNLQYKPPIAGKERDALLGGARCMLMPTQYCEPFGGAGVEGLMCGTPLIASDFGAFSETVTPGVNGFRCKTLRDWVYAVKDAKHLTRAVIANDARNKYRLEKVGIQYEKAFLQILGLNNRGWYAI